MTHRGPSLQQAGHESLGRSIATRRLFGQRFGLSLQRFRHGEEQAVNAVSVDARQPFGQFVQRVVEQLSKLPWQYTFNCFSSLTATACRCRPYQR